MAIDFRTTFKFVPLIAGDKVVNLSDVNLDTSIPRSGSDSMASGTSFPESPILNQEFYLTRRTREEHLYMNGGTRNALFIVDAMTGIATRVGSADRYGNNIEEMTGIASHNGVLYGVAYSRTLAPSNNHAGLYTINASTGVATRVNSSVNDFGVNNISRPSGLASINGTLYLLTFEALYTLNESTGVATRVGSAYRYGVNEFQARGIAYHNGQAYMVGTVSDQLNVLDLTTGRATRVGSANRFGIGEQLPLSLASYQGNLYMGGNTSHELLTLDTTTGIATRVGSAVDFGVNETSALGLTTHSSSSDIHEVGNYRYNGTVWEYLGDFGVISKFTDLTDTPSSLGTSGQILRVNSSGTSLEFIDAPNPVVNFSELQGTISSNQIPNNLISSFKLSSSVRGGLLSNLDRQKLNSISSGAEVNVQSDWNVTSTSSDAYIRNKPTLPTSAQLLTPTDRTKLDQIESGATSDQTPSEIRQALESLSGDARLDASALKNLPELENLTFDNLSGNIFPRQIATGGIQEIKLEQSVRDKLNLIGHTRLSNIDLIPSIDLKTSELTYTRHHSFQNLTSGNEGIFVRSVTGFTSQTNVLNLNYLRTFNISSDLSNQIIILKIDKDSSITDYRLSNTQTSQLGSPVSYIGGSHFVLLRTEGEFSYYVMGSSVDSFNLNRFRRGTRLTIQKDETTSVSTVFHGSLPDNSIAEVKLAQAVRDKLNAMDESGTEVVANSGGNPQTQLTSISIDGENYSIPQPEHVEGITPSDRTFLDHVTFTHEETPPAFQRTHLAPEVILINQFKALYREDIRTTGVENEIDDSIFSINSQPPANQRFYYEEESSLDPFDTVGSQIYGGQLALNMDFNNVANNSVRGSRTYNFGFQYSLIANNQGVNGLIGFRNREPLLSFDSSRGLIARVHNEVSSGSHSVSETHREYYAVNNAILGTVNGQTHDTARLEFLQITNGQELTIEIVEQRNGIVQSQVPPHRTFNLDTTQSRNPVVTFPTNTFVNSAKAFSVRFDHDAGDNGTLIIHGSAGQDNGYVYEVRVYRNVTTTVTIDQTYFSQVFGNVGNGTDSHGLKDPSLYDTSQVNRQNNVLLTLRPTFTGTTSTDPLMSINMSIGGHFFSIDTHRTLSDITGVSDLTTTVPVLQIGSSIAIIKHIYITSGSRPIPQDVMNQASVSTREYLGFFDFESSNLDTINFRADDIQLNGQSLLGRQPILIATQQQGTTADNNPIILTTEGSEIPNISSRGTNNRQLWLPRLAPDGYNSIRMVMSSPNGTGGFTPVAETNLPYGLYFDNSGVRTFHLYADGTGGSRRIYRIAASFSAGNFFIIEMNSGGSGTLTGYRVEFYLMPSGGQKGEKGDPGGATNFTELDDTPANLGQSGQIVAVNVDGTGLEFIDAPSSSGTVATSFSQLSGSIGLSQITDNLITEVKLAQAVRDKLNATGGATSFSQLSGTISANQIADQIISLSKLDLNVQFRLLSNQQRTKLNNIEDRAEVNVQADWNETSTSSDAYIRNKPTNLGGGASNFSQLSGSIGLNQIADNLITEVKLAQAVRDKLNATGGASSFSELSGTINTNQIPTNAVTEVKLSQIVRDKLNAQMTNFPMASGNSFPESPILNQEFYLINSENDQTLYNTFYVCSSSRLYRLDITTGTVNTYPNSIASSDLILNLAVNNGELFATNLTRRYLMRVDTSTGRGTRVGSTTNFGIGTSITAIASHNGILYGAGADRRLYTINTTTGVATQVSSNQTLLTNASGMASLGGNLYIIHGSTDALYTVDTTTGIETRIGSASNFGAGISLPQDLTSYDGKLYLVSFNNNRIYNVDRNTGVATLLSFNFGSSINQMRGIASRVVTPHQQGNYRYNGTRWERLGDYGVISKLTDLTDTPSSLGTSGQILRVNSSGTSLEFIDAPSSASSFSELSGTISSNQIPNSAIDFSKLNTSLRNQLFTSTERSKLAGIGTGAERNVQSDWNETNTSADDYIRNKPTIPSRLSQLSGTLFSSQIPSNAIDSSKLTTSLRNQLFTSTERSKLAGIGTGAERNVQADWNVTSTSSDAYIRNKPTIPSSFSQLSGSISSSQIPSNAVTESKLDSSTRVKLNRFSTTDESKLNGIQSGAERNVQADWNETSSSSDAYIRNKPTNLGGSRNGIPSGTSFPSNPPTNQGFYLTRAITTGGGTTTTQRVYAVGNSSNSLFEISISNRGATRIGSTTNFGVSENSPMALAWHLGNLYMTGSARLYRISTTTGVATRVGTLTGYGVSENAGAGLTSHNGILYMIGDGTNALYRLNSGSGFAARIGPSVTAFGVSEFAPAGLTSHNGSLYMVGRGYGGALYRVSSVTGIATRVGSLSGFGVSQGFPTSVASIGGTLYMIAGRQLYSLSTSTGRATLLGNLVSSGIQETGYLGFTAGGTSTTSTPGTTQEIGNYRWTGSTWSYVGNFGYNPLGL